MRESYTKQRTDACGLIVPDVTWGADESPEDRRAERRFLVAALVEHRLFGAASPELVIRRAGLGRVEGFSARTPVWISPDPPLARVEKRERQRSP